MQTTNSTPFTVLVAGAGVGGLTLAKALAVKAKEAGCRIRVIVLERSPCLVTGGHGLTLFEGVGILKRLGVNADKVSSVLTQQAVWADGRSILEAASSNPSPFAARGIRRPDLVKLLYDSLQEEDSVKICFDWELSDVVQEGDKVRITNTRNEALVGDIVVGFDGISSRVRKAIHGSNQQKRGEAKEFGQCCVLLGTAKLEQKKLFPAGTLVHHFDRTTGSVGVYSGTTDGGFAWTIGYRCPKEPERNPDWKNNGKALASAKDIVAQWKGEAPTGFGTLLNRSHGCLQLGVYTQSEATSKKAWSRGRMVLGGDAAHAVLPLLGEGANLAMADAAVLARHVVASVDAASTTPPTDLLLPGFQSYEAERRGPGQSGLAMTKGLRPIMLTQSWPVAQARNVFMRHMVAANWKDSHLRGQDAFGLLDRPVKDRNPHANIGSNVGVVLAHVSVLVVVAAIAVYVSLS